MPEDPTEASKAKKITLEPTVSHRNGTDFINGGTFYDQRLVSSYFVGNLSTTVAIGKISNASKDELSLGTGLLTSWKDWDDRGVPYKDTPLRQRSLNTLKTSKTFKLGEHDALHVAMSSMLVASDGQGPTSSYLNAEIKRSHNGDRFVGVGGIVGEYVAKNQVYVMAGYEGMRLNLGAYEVDASTHTLGVRAMTSYDWSLDEKNKLQFFASGETGAQGQQRAGVIYQTKINKISFRSDIICNSKAAQGLENLNVRADIPVAINPKSKHELEAVINAFAGISGELESATTPNPALHLVYGVGVQLTRHAAKPNQR